MKENCAKDREKERDGSGITKRDPDPEAGPGARESGHASESDGSCATASGCGSSGSRGAVTECEGAKE